MARFILRVYCRGICVKDDVCVEKTEGNTNITIRCRTHSYNIMLNDGENFLCEPHRADFSLSESGAQAHRIHLGKGGSPTEYRNYY